MFSRTVLGRLVDQALRGALHGIATHDHPLLMVNLLLADALLFRDQHTLQRIIEWLRPIYDNQGAFRLYEETPSYDVQTMLRMIVDDETVSANPTALAYLRGLADLAPASNAPRTACAVYRRMRRVFYRESPGFLPSETNITPIGILGLKGAGKSLVLKQLITRGKEVHEVYEHLDSMSRRGADLTGLPEPCQWEAEPLMLSLHDRGWHRAWPRRFFVGSLLRLSEAEELYRIGRPVFIHVTASNEMRHVRVRNRGRRIEVATSDDWLVELDAHRGGEWPGYETNDLGTLVSLAGLTVMNDGTRSVDELVEEILSYVDNNTGGG